MSRFEERSGITVTFHLAGTAAALLPDNVQAQLTRILQEALANVGNHSGAAAAAVRLEEQAGGELRLTIVLMDLDMPRCSGAPRGESPVAGAVARKVMLASGRKGPAPAEAGLPGIRLSPREVQILERVAAGETNKAIGTARPLCLFLGTPWGPQAPKRRQRQAKYLIPRPKPSPLSLSDKRMGPSLHKIEQSQEEAIQPAANHQ